MLQVLLLQSERYPKISQYLPFIHSQDSDSWQLLNSWYFNIWFSYVSPTNALSCSPLPILYHGHNILSVAVITYYYHDYYHYCYYKKLFMVCFIIVFFITFITTYVCSSVFAFFIHLFIFYCHYYHNKYYFNHYH